MSDSSIFTRIVTGNPVRKKQDAHEGFEEDITETPLSRVPLGQGKSKSKDTQPESSQLPPGSNRRES